MKTANINKKIKAFVLSVIVGFALLAMPVGAFASSDVSLDPASGSFSSDFSVELQINTNGDSINGVDIDLDLSGPIEYVGVTTGDLGCVPSVEEVEAGTLSVICFIPPGTEFNGDGFVGTFFFSPDGSGSVTIDPSYVDIAGSSAGATTGGSYTVSQTTTTTTTTTSTTSTTTGSTTSTSSTSTTSTSIILQPTSTSTTSTTVPSSSSTIQPTTTSTTVPTSSTTIQPTTTSIYVATTTVYVTSTTVGSTDTLPDTAILGLSNSVVAVSGVVLSGCLLFFINIKKNPMNKKNKKVKSSISMKEQV